MNLKLIERNSTADTILNILANSTPVSNETNIVSFLSFLLRKGNALNTTKFYRFFVDLQKAGAGKLEQDTIGKPLKFFWKTSPKEVASEILALDAPKIKKRGRPFGSKNKPKKKEESMVTMPVQFMGNVPKRGRPAGAKNKPKAKQIYIMFGLKSGETVPFSLEDAENLLQHVKKVKQNVRM